MKVIIAGGRDFIPAKRHWRLLDRLYSQYKWEEVVSGKATGADKFGEDWQKLHKDVVGLAEFPADWDNLDVKNVIVKVNKYGKKYNAIAGHNRNEEMAEYADAIILLPGGNGTADMRRRAVAHDLKILYEEN